MAKLIVISGPSGVGKSTVVAQVVAGCRQPICLSVSATTRAPRPGEIDGKSYHFLTHEQFAEHRRQDDFLECAEVFGRGDWYGTLRQPVTEALKAGIHVVLEIDVEGAKAVMAKHPGVLTMFIHPGSLEELERRLRGRNTESESSIERRLAVAAEELRQSGLYQHVIVNHDVAQTVVEICRLIETSGESSCTKN
ncbi:MAG: guanylate kinase [Planctomycetaceae bacterium]|nr:guanylate kinase [Planctomycetaceae bacterium]